MSTKFALDSECYVVAIIVSFNPDINQLSKLVETLRPDVADVVIVDNASNVDVRSSLAHCSDESVYVLRQDSNLGVAEGQNVGIRWAKDAGANYIILFDQDSLPERTMVKRLVTYARDEIAAGRKVGAVGPFSFDERWKKPLPFVKVINGSYHRVADQKSTTGALEVDHVISSGALIPMDTLTAVGYMRAELFIDYIDIEWCLRAKVMGYPIYGLMEARMSHSLGDDVVQILGRQISMHSPVRDYYLFRNAVWMMRQPWINASWKAAEAKRLFLRFAFYSFFAKARLAQIRYMLLGLKDGLLSVHGQSKHAP